RALVEEFLRLALGGDTGKVALDVGGEHRHARSGKTFGENLQRHGLPGARRTGDQPVAVGKLEIEKLGLAALANEDLAVLLHRLAPLFSPVGIDPDQPRFARCIISVRHGAPWPECKASWWGKRWKTPKASSNA